MTSLLDQHVYLVPNDAIDEDLREAFTTDSPAVIEVAKREQFKELGGIVFSMSQSASRSSRSTTILTSASAGMNG